jgi:hypothetical protein
MLCVFNMSGQEARLHCPDMESAQILNFGCGTAVADGASIELGAFAACFIGQQRVER